ncbi:MAG: hypothetical protein RIS48_737, partial [Pseudomonadota bacterium]
MKILTLAAVAALSAFGLQAHAGAAGDKLVQKHLCM